MFPAMNFGALERYRVPVDWKGELSDIDPRDREAIPFRRPETEAATAADIAEIDRLQEILYAQAKYALLVVLQGLDTSGKDGTIDGSSARSTPSARSRPALRNQHLTSWRMIFCGASTKLCPEWG
jgi:polyphosphate kinase 2 (PPK2 family)